MSVFDNILDSLLEMFAPKKVKSRFEQYKHGGQCSNPCKACSENFDRIFERGTGPTLPIHLNCDCRHVDVEVMQVGMVSILGKNGPDFWLKHYGRLPDYYITKKDAETLGWRIGKNTVEGKVPSKMIGGDVFKNKPPIFPEKPGRIWYECDVDYFSGKRGSARLLYSNDGLIFYSPTHYAETFFFVE